MSWGWVNGFTNVTELYGIGQYAEDSWNIFQLGNLTNLSNDKVLAKYLQEIE